MALPVYVAATVFVPTVPKATWHVATPAFRVCVPPVHVMLFPPLVNETVPVGVPLPGLTAATVAVKVTVCPVTEGLTDDVRAVVVLAAFTVCVIGEDVEPVKTPAPG